MERRGKQKREEDEKKKREEEEKKKGAVPKKPLKDVIKEKRQFHKSGKHKMEGTSLRDPFKATSDLKDNFRKSTCYGYVPSLDHKSPWDPDHPERPERCVAIHEALEPVMGRLHTITNDELLTIDDNTLIQHVHPSVYIEKIRDMCVKKDQKQAEQYDSVFYNDEASFWAAARAAKMTTTICKLIAEGKFQNGFANVRPPGHHAGGVEPNGYCFFNNVAIAANYLLEEKLADRILIVDFDVHHGQGTQNIFYNNKQVIYFSIHRYEQGTYWPNLKDGQYSFLGTGAGSGYNINVPLNETGINDYDYLAIFLNILMPIAYEFDPSIVLVSAGYDACIGDPEGQMNVTPAFYGHLMTLLSGLARGKLAVILEGGYFIPSLAEAALRTVRALLNDPCSKLEYSRHINPSVRETINDLRDVLRQHWRSIAEMEPPLVREDIYKYDYYRYGLFANIKPYIGEVERPPFPLKGCYPINKPIQEKMFLAQLEYFKEDRNIDTPTRVGYMMNHDSINHNPPAEQRTQEVHMRIMNIMKKLKEYNLLDRMIEIEFEHTREDIVHPIIWEDVWEQMITTHSASYIYELGARKEDDSKADLYWSKGSRTTCQWSVAILCQLARKIKQGFIYHGVGIIRPPGHHAKTSEGGGFCLVNNVVVAANYLIRKLGYKKVLIVDFDVHHGDGTQEMTYSRNDIMYISMHRYDEGKFYPKDRSGNYNYLGEDKGLGYNINIPFNADRMENADYLYTWFKMVIPLCYAYNPEIILVSAGFDAGVHDPLGHYNISPEVYGHFIQTLKGIAPLILALEGGYNFETTSLGMVNCVRALTGQSLPMPALAGIKMTTMKAVSNVVASAKSYWPVLEVNKVYDPKANKRDSSEEGGFYRRYSLGS